ncbi:MAG TPA: hypothetical protein VK196_03405 [Magnetospirillum sp.]|nr:hypothetical protein [Magnetospirillum sp.]
MDLARLGAGVVAVAAALVSPPVWAQWNNQPYSYRSGGSAGISTAYRQAILDQQLTGNRPRALLRGEDGSLLSVLEKDRQAFVAVPQPNYVVNRGGAYAGGAYAGVAGGAVTWGRASAPVDVWVGQLEGLRPLQ